MQRNKHMLFILFILPEMFSASREPRETNSWLTPAPLLRNLPLTVWIMLRPYLCFPEFKNRDAMWDGAWGRREKGKDGRSRCDPAPGVGAKTGKLHHPLNSPLSLWPLFGSCCKKRSEYKERTLASRGFNPLSVWPQSLLYTSNSSQCPLYWLSSRRYSARDFFL